MLAERQPDEESEFYKLFVGEVVVKFLPERVIGKGRLPDDGAGVGEGDLLAFREFIGIREMQEFGVLRFWNASRSGPDRSLRPSILALDGLRDVDPAQLFE